MNRVEGTSRLWPVLGALVVLPLGAIGLEQYALNKGSAVRVIHVEASHAVEGDDVDVTIAAAISPAHEAARALLKQGDDDGAAKAYAPLSTDNPSSAAIAFEYGAALLGKRDVDGALAQLNRAKELAGSDPRVAVVLSRALQKKKDAAGAEAELKRALQLRPGYGAALRALGKLYAGADRSKEAIEVLTQASQFGSNEERATALVALGAVLLDVGRADDARVAFDQAIERAPAQVEIRLGIARAYLSTNKKDDATKASGVLAVAADLAPDLADVQTLLGQVREATGDIDGAEDAYWQSIRLAPRALFPRRRLLRLSLDRQKFVKAKQHADELLSIDDGEAEHHFLAGLVASKQGDAAAARKHYADAIARADGDYPEAYFNLGILERDEKHLDDAIAAYQKAIVQRPGYHAAENNLGLTLVAAGRADEAEKLYRDVLAKTPAYAPAWINLGKLYSQQKKYDDAVDAYTKALQAKPDSARALLDLGVAYARMGKVDDAITTYGKVIALNPRSVSALFNLALVQTQKGDKTAAEASLRKAREIDADHVPSSRKLASLLAARGADDDARALYEDVLDGEPQDVDARLGHAALLGKAGDKDGCARDLAAARPRVASDEQRALFTAIEKTCPSPGAKP